MIEEVFRRTNFVDAGLILIASIAIVGFWRGVWSLMDILIFPGSPIVSNFITIVFALIVLLWITLYRGRKRKIKSKIQPE